MGRPTRPGWKAFNDLATNETLLKLSAETFRAWFQIMCAAQPHEGILPKDTTKQFSWKADQALRYLAHLERAGLIEKHKQTFRVVHWAGAGTPPKTVAERVKRYRAKNGTFSKPRETLQEPPVTLHVQPETLQPPEAEKTQQNQQLTSSEVRLLDQNSDFGVLHTSPRIEEEVNKVEKKVEETEGVKGGAPPAPETLQKPKPRKGVTLPEGFEAFWAEYPSRGPNARSPKKPAIASYARALTVKGASADLILYGAKRYKEAMAKMGKADTEFVAMAATWLNQHSWEQYTPVISSTPSERARAGAAQLMQKVFVDEGSPAWDAWQTHLRARGKPGSICRPYHDPTTGINRTGWWFDSAYPPGVTNGKATEGAEGRTAAEMEGDLTKPEDGGGSGDGPPRPAEESGSGDDFGAAAPDDSFG